MDDRDGLAQRFEENCTHLRSVAYRMLGSLSEAEDALQEAWLHLSRSEKRSVENLKGWLTTVAARVCLDMLRSRPAAPTAVFIKVEPILRTRCFGGLCEMYKHPT